MRYRQYPERMIGRNIVRNVNVAVATIFVFFTLFITSSGFTLPSFTRLASSRISHHRRFASSAEVLSGEVGSAPLKQLKLTFNCDDVDSDEISELLYEMGVLSVSVEVVNEKKYLNDETKWEDLQKTRSWQNALLRANFPSSFNQEGLSDILSTIYPQVKFEMDVVDVVNQDWVSVVQQDWKPQIIGDLTIKFPWHIDEKTSTNLELILEGGAAFGTGDHPTTRLCTKWLSRNVDKKQKTTSVLDYGCGSAILGLAALRYGAGRAVGTDIDKDALISATRNCENNGLHMDFYLVDDGEDTSVSMSVLKGGISEHDFPPVSQLSSEQFDLVVANILAPILVLLAPTLAQHTKSGGKIALSGLVTQQADVIVKRYSEFFADVKVEDVEEGWILVTGTKL